MAATAQARITEESRDRLVRLTARTGKTQQEVIEMALRRYERELFLDLINEGYAALRADAAAWKDHQTERDEWDNTLGDGAG